MQSVPR